MIRPDVEIPAEKIDTSDPTGYPFGKAQNITTPGDGTGTPLIAEWLNDVFGFFAALANYAGITPSGTPDKVGASQLLEALEYIIADKLSVLEVLNFFILGARYSGKSFVVSQDTLPRGMFIRADGLKLYVVGDTNNTVYQYTLSVAWDISTASYDTVSFSVNSEAGTASGVYFSSDGARMYVLDETGDTVYQYDLGTPWVVSSAVYNAVSKAVADGNPNWTSQDITFSPDGSRMYIVGNASGGGTTGVSGYTLSTPWSLATASFTSIVSVASQETAPRGVAFNEDGTRMFVVGQTSDTVFEYSLSTPWLVSSATYTGNSFSIAAIVGAVTTLFFKPNGSRFYVINDSDDTAYQYYSSLVIGG